MNLRASIFAVPATLAALLVVANCGSLDAQTRATGGGGTGAAPSGGTSGGGNDAGFVTLKGIIASMACSGGGCHDDPGNPLQLRGVTDAVLYMTLMTHVTPSCGKVIDTANPAQSALITMLTGTCAAIVAKTPGVDRMPLAKCNEDGDPGCVSPADIATIQQWIASGAPQ
jgi:hypothetical protein